ncbi:molybdopterin synthase catalytic subunit-like [Stomoxys calcitrans]|uniref:molybdopterin synthase catalytic subunit-like n=1 Tax=Stomoxys calcitrans TaxID=35570 RepID=UPI0027E2BA46|nr:molybdopterin synthase catalytic subunit-like [Stomoxys calcitrans]
MNYLLLTRDALDIGSITELASSEVCGSTSLYVGMARGSLGGKNLLSLEFGASEAMAEKEMENICGELRFRWPNIVNIVIYHRIGLVPLGEAYVAIAISHTSQQSKASLDVVGITMDELKARVPIWRKEKYDTDDSFTICAEGQTDKFDENLCGIQDANPLPSKFVQISANETEIVRRIQSFIERKRDEIDLSNIVDYIRPSSLEEMKQDINSENCQVDSCARINGTIIKQENSKCHLKIRKTDNKMGPQMQHDYLYALDNLMESSAIPQIKQENLHDWQCATDTKQILLERARNIEEHLNIRDCGKKNIYQRLKLIEDRLLYLESISPEYRHVLFAKPIESKDSTIASETYSAGLKHSPNVKRGPCKVYDIAEIDQIIEAESQRI